jgi:hypothetical protein
LKKRITFWLLYVVVLVGVTIGGAEIVSSFLVPTYPARDIRPVTVVSKPDLAYNDWALRDKPRTFAWPAGIDFRTVLVGDSFLEGFNVRGPLSEFVGDRLKEAGRSDMETINFGVSATGPPQYYYRIKDVALRLKPSLIVLCVYAGNDFVSTPYGGVVPPLIAELPLPSLLGVVAPRTTWLTVNRLGLSEFGKGNKPIEGEYDMLNEWVELPSAERMDKLVAHMKRYYYPQLDEPTIREILSRGGDNFWSVFQKSQKEPEHLMGWMLNSMIDWETGTWPMSRNAEDAERRGEGNDRVAETMSWLVAARKLAQDNGTQLVVALFPVGVVDPRYVAYWSHWPQYYSYNFNADARHRHLAFELAKAGLPFVDMRPELMGIPGTYRLTDGHWTALGFETVAKRLSQEILKLRKK